ncbi:MAG: hypothetical protein ACE5PM_08075, partial [Candidatus Hydrothermarchaeales archaeon]
FNYKKLLKGVAKLVISFPERLEQTESLADIFELVKEAVRRKLHTGRAGLNLGLAELGGHKNYLIGAFYPVGSNIIIMNKTPLRKITESNPALFKPYSFHILLHEYLHSLGNLDERYTRDKTYQITRDIFGPEHLATLISEDMSRFLPYLVYPTPEWAPEEGLFVEMVPNFDRSSINYIT